MNNAIDLLYYFLVSILGIYFYVRMLSVKYTRKTSKILLGILIFASHIILLIPVNMEIFINIIQISGEFIIICMFTKGKFAEKLMAYVMMNIALGLGTFAAGLVIKLNVINNIMGVMEYGSTKRIVFYSVEILTAYIILTGIILLRGKLSGFLHIQGMEILVCVAVEVLCFLYVTGMMMIESKGSWKFSVISIFLLLLIIVYAFMKVSNYIKEKEKIYLEYYVVKNVEDSTEYIVNRLKENADYFRQQADFMNNGICEAYKAVENISEDMLPEVLLKNKREKAENAGADMDISIETDNGSFVEAKDYISMLANLLDNAIEAVSKNHVNNRKITVRGSIKRESFYLEIENPYEEEPVCIDGEFKTTKVNKEGHGLGIKSVRSLAEKYGMAMEVRVENGRFCVAIRSAGGQFSEI